MAMSGNFGAEMGGPPKRAVREKRQPRLSRVPPAAPVVRAMPGGPLAKQFPPAPAAASQPVPKAFKPMAPLVSTKPSDAPMAMAKMKMAKTTAGVTPLAAMPKVNPKPVGKTPGKRVTRPKTGLK